MAASLGIVAIALVVLTWRRPLVWDAQVFHYIHFLIHHGFALYRDIPDIDMPGVMFALLHANGGSWNSVEP
ncbi:MAG TPA: hypothetical protein VGM02_05795 [Acidobacteriaceae bacterium]|jgi:hypothetical protein